MIPSQVNKFAAFTINLVFQMAQLHPLKVPTISTQYINCVQCLLLFSLCQKYDIQIKIMCVMLSTSGNSLGDLINQRLIVQRIDHSQQKGQDLENTNNDHGKSSYATVTISLINIVLMKLFSFISIGRFSSRYKPVILSPVCTLESSGKLFKNKVFSHPS